MLCRYKYSSATHFSDNTDEKMDVSSCLGASQSCCHFHKRACETKPFILTVTDIHARWRRRRL